mgnify:CR=1 FL=1
MPPLRAPRPEHRPTQTYSQARGSGSGRAGAFKAERAQRAQDAPAARTPTESDGILTPPPNQTHRRTHTPDRRYIYRRGARGAGRRADATGEGAAAKGRKAGRPPKHSHDVAGRACDKPSQRAPNGRPAENRGEGGAGERGKGGTPASIRTERHKGHYGHP